MQVVVRYALHGVKLDSFKGAMLVTTVWSYPENTLNFLNQESITTEWDFNTYFNSYSQAKLQSTCKIALIDPVPSYRMHKFIFVNLLKWALETLN